VHLFSPWHILVLLFTVGFTVLVAMALVVFTRSAAARSRPAAPAPAVRPAAERLAELDDMLQRGSITAQEHGEARARVLGDV
jgi:nitric oxide reductase large subunit